jgi:IclR family KDG regulon transcriptional repressor
MFDGPNGDGTVGKAMQVLDQVSSFGCPVRFSELLADSPFPKPTLYRLLQTLTNQGMLAFDPERQTYSMGIRLVRLAHSAWRHSSLVPIARPHIESLAETVGEAVHLAQFDNGHVLFVDKYKVTDMFDTLAQAGKIAPGYCTGVGKAILAFMTEAQQNRSLDQQSYKAYTPATLSDRTALVAELAWIRKNGVAYDREEHEQGIISIASPILTSKGRVVGAVSIATSTNRYKISDLKKQKPYLLKCANLIGTEAESWQVPTWS